MRVDSLNSKSIEKNIKISTIFITEGTLISGIDKIVNGRLKSSKGKRSMNISETHKKQLKKVKKIIINPDTIKNSRKFLLKRFKISTNDTKKKYFKPKALKAITENEHRSNYLESLNYAEIRLFFKEKSIIKTSKRKYIFFYINEASFIRPPPEV